MSNTAINFNLTIKNYRCFPDQQPVHISMDDGFTALIGINNSGKSSLLKLFYEFRDIFNRMSHSSGNLHNAIQVNEGESFSKSDSVRDYAELFCNTNTRDIVLEFEVHNHDRREGESPQRIVLTIKRETSRFKAQIFLNAGLLSVKPNVTINNVEDSYLKIGNVLIDMKPYYQAFSALSRIVYIGPFRNAINIGGSTSYFDMTVGQQFVELWKTYKTGDNKNNIKAAIRLTEDIRSIFRFNNLEINAAANNQTLQVLVDGKPYSLDELGSGLAQFIIVFGNIAAKQPSWVLIDEPELNLHASLQVDFLTTLASYTTHGILYATHSLGLARVCADRIYSFNIDQSGSSVVRDFESTPNYSEFLGELSYKGYQDLGFDKILLVEGPTEVRTIQQFLRKYHKDHEIVMLPLGGASLINANSEHELQEIKRMSENVYALIDSERDGPEASLSPDRQKFVEICGKANINCCVLERRALENYLTDRAVKLIKDDKYRALDPYERLQDASPSWGKQENWRIAREMSLEELSQTDLGKFLGTL